MIYLKCGLLLLLSVADERSAYEKKKPARAGFFLRMSKGRLTGFP